MKPSSTTTANGRGRTRREFLANSALAAGAAAFLGTTEKARAAVLNHPVLRAKPRTPLGREEPVRIAVIGPGGMGQGHIEALISINESGREYVDIVAVCDVCSIKTQEGLKRIKNRTGKDAEGYSDYRKVLERDDIHGVLIASPEHWHWKQVIDAVHAGKDVYCEKPMTLRLHEALKVREVQNANPDVIVQVGTQKMMLPKYNEAQRLIADGAIGHPTFSQTSYCRNTPTGEWNYYAIRPEIKPGETIDWKMWCGPLGERPWDPLVYARWRRYKDFSTGIVGDLLVHEMTPLMMALQAGYPTRVVATGGHYLDKAMENHDQVNLQVQFGGKDHTMIVAGATNNDLGLETMIRGNKATMFLAGKDVLIRPQPPYVHDVEEQTVECPNIGNDQDELRINWLQCMRSRQAPKSPVEFATQVMVAVDLATRSMWEGKAFEFDPETHEARAI